MQIDLLKYSQFVEGVTSNASNDFDAFIAQLNQMRTESDANIPLLLTSAIGLGGEAGEFEELVKKAIFHKKPITEETRAHALRELGDVIWYWINACRALNIDPNEVIAENVNKLSARYPGGKFDPFYSENRKDGDI